MQRRRNCVDVLVKQHTTSGHKDSFSRALICIFASDGIHFQNTSSSNGYSRSTSKESKLFTDPQPDNRPCLHANEVKHRTFASVIHSGSSSCTLSSLNGVSATGARGCGSAGLGWGWGEALSTFPAAASGVFAVKVSSANTELGAAELS